MKPPYINDTDYSSDQIEEVKEYIKGLRDSALKNTHFDHAVQLSIVHALLVALQEEVAKSEPVAAEVSHA